MENKMKNITDVWDRNWYTWGLGEWECITSLDTGKQNFQKFSLIVIENKAFCKSVVAY